jgi:hypothetical protein
MNQPENKPLDADRIIELINQSLKQGGENNAAPSSASGNNSPLERAWKRLMNTWFMGDDRPAHSHRPILGSVIVAFKKITKPVVKAPLAGTFQAQRELDAQLIEVLKQFKQQLEENQKITGEWVTRDQLRELLDQLINYHGETLKTVQSVESRLNDMQYRLEHDLVDVDRKRVLLEAKIEELQRQINSLSREDKP